MEKEIVEEMFFPLQRRESIYPAPDRASWVYKAMRGEFIIEGGERSDDDGYFVVSMAPDKEKTGYRIRVVKRRAA